MSNSDQRFAGSIPRIYETHLVPLIFEPYAADLAKRVSAMNARRILEVACGTGIVTRALAQATDADIIATDLNQAMLDEAAAVGMARPVQWQTADVLALPFGDRAFDVVVCQFGVMFFPDKVAGFREIWRVLAAGGTFVFNVWDRLAENDFAATVATAVKALFPEDPPRFLERSPHGYCERATIERDLAQAGFRRRVEMATLAARSRAESARVPAIGFCQGTPLRNEIEARDAARLADATEAAAAAIARKFGSGAVEGKMQALVVTAEK